MAQFQDLLTADQLTQLAHVRLVMLCHPREIERDKQPAEGRLMGTEGQCLQK